MDIKEAINHTINKKGMYVSFTGIASRANKPLDKGQRYMIQEMGKHYQQTREAWLKGDLETVAEFFGLYV